MGQRASSSNRKALPKDTITQEITGRLMRYILDGQFKPGDKLPSEPELGRSFQVRRNAMREALKALSFVGLIREERGKGTFVRDRSEFLIRPLSLGLEEEFDLQSLIGARRLIEEELVGLAAERASQEESRRMECWLDRMDQSVSASGGDGFPEADIEFHFAIAQASHNALLGRFLTLTRNLLHKWFPSHDSVYYPPGLWQALAEHREILEAVRGGRPTEARQAMNRHLVRAANRLLAVTAGQRRERNRLVVRG